MAKRMNQKQREWLEANPEYHNSPRTMDEDDLYICDVHNALREVREIYVDRDGYALHYTAPVGRWVKTRE